MARIFTRTGDGGTTHLGDNRTVGKDARRVSVSGVIDEATSALGVARAAAPPPVAEAILALQKDLVRMMGRISLYSPDAPLMPVDEIERRIDGIRAEVPVADAFVYPGESEAGAALHLARSTFRRAEREFVALAHEEDVSPEDLKWINRISDYVYALALWADYEETVARVTRAVAEKISDGDAPAVPHAMTLDAAKRLIRAMERAAADGGVPMAMAVCDAGGALVAFARQNGTLPVSIGLARRKAFTATQLRCPTADLADATAPGGTLWGLQADPELVVFGGGIPLYAGRILVGAVGVSGGTVAEDVAVAESAVAAWKRFLE